MIGFLIFIVMLNDVFYRCYIGILSSQIYDKLGKNMPGAVYFPRIKVPFCLVFRLLNRNIEACASKVLEGPLALGNKGGIILCSSHFVVILLL
ncbi:MAG: hypothetical protein UHK44_07585, partial [Bacteroidaceae bacterium]|nr:hypothetical protein [Bacteroidaceae bacterium]